MYLRVISLYTPLSLLLALPFRLTAAQHCCLYAPQKVVKCCKKRWKMKKKWNETVIIKNTFSSKWLCASGTLSLSLSQSLSRALAVSHLTLTNVAYEQFRCVRISTSSASGACDIAGHSVYAKHIYINRQIYVLVSMYLWVCVCVADPSPRQQLNLTVVRVCGSVVCCQTNKKAKNVEDSSLYAA